ncbi:MAG: hypothetical protein EAX95_12430 [Candidatus Thorarchaeota archaeon]|nr:hypothetical protein [Candidatus Thorarchaeota archaeon]
MKILGLMGRTGTPCHDGSAALLVNGKLMVAVEQERVSRRKHSPGESASKAARICLEYGGVPFEEIDHITYGWVDADIHDESSEALGIHIIRSEANFNEIVDDTELEYETPRPIHFVKHHIAHIEGAYWASGFQDAACLVVDGRGENESITLAEVSESGIRVIRTYDVKHSLGILYDAATEFSGLGLDVPGKFMGLSSFGRPYESKMISFSPKSGNVDNVIAQHSPSDEPGSEAEVYAEWLRHFKENCYPYEIGSKEMTWYYVDFASTVQQTLTQCLVSLCKYLRSNVSSANLILTGGVALNCLANQEVHKSHTFDRIFVHPGSNDAGASIGSAYALCRYMNCIPSRNAEWKFNPFLGTDFTDHDISRALKDKQLLGNFLDDAILCQKVANDLSQNLVVAWFQGRMEFGPRALGGRSILGDPRKRSNLTRINRIKGREIWRPLAPSVLEGSFFDLFEDTESVLLSNYMLTTAIIRNDWKRKIPAVVHIDGTTRPQVVQKDQILYRSLIEEFSNLTGIPLVINTSFNLQGEPIVNSPEDAIDVFMRCEDIDVLVLGNRYCKRGIRTRGQLVDDSEN